MESVEFAKHTQFLLRKAVAHFVREDLLLGTYCQYDQLCIPISKLMCGWEGQEDMKQIDHKMLVDAFSAKGGTKVYCVPFWQVVGGEETDPDYDGYFIHVTNGERKSMGGRKERVYKIGCVKGEEDEPETIPDNNKHPLKDGSRMRDFTLSKDELWVGMRDELTEFLRERKGTEVHLKKGNTKKAQKAKLEKEKEENAKRSRPGTAKSADTAKSKESGTSPSKRWKRRRKKQQHTELRNKIEKKKEELVELLLELQKKLKEDETEDYRWMSVIKTLKVFIKHWTSIYFLAVTIKQSTNKQKNSLLSSYAESLIGHMSTRPLQEEYNILLDGDSTEQIEIPPTLYAQGQWILAFAASFFERHFNFLMHFDSKFGEDSYGHVARLYPERVFVMHRDIKRLEEGGWRYDPAFAEYLKVVAKFPSPREGFNDEIKDGGKAFFAYAEKVFFPCFRFHFNKHVASCVRTTTSLDPASKSAPNTARILPYMIGGHPDLARELLYWLNRAEDQEGIQMGDGDEDGVYDGFQHSFASREIVLDHNEGDLPPFKIKTDECMEYLTEGVDPIEMLQIPLIKDNKDLLWMMAFAQPDATVDIFDAETWTVGHDFEPVLNEVHKRVAPHCCHGQGVENHVQSAGHVRKTKVGEERGSHRGTAHSYLIRRFNTGAVQKLRSEKATAEEKKKIVRIWGRKRTQFFADYVDDFTTAVDKAAAAMDGDKYKALNEYIGSEESRQSTKETKELINKVKGGVGKKRKVTKSEMIGGVDVTADMDGGILFSILTKTNGHEPHVDAEIVQRGIESKLTLPLEETSIGEKLKLLKQVAKVEWIAAGRAGQTNFIIPQSDMMKSLFARQRELVAEKRAKKS